MQNWPNLNALQNMFIFPFVRNSKCHGQILEVLRYSFFHDLHLMLMSRGTYGVEKVCSVLVFISVDGAFVCLRTNCITYYYISFRCIYPRSLG